jgi:putative transposase
LELISDWRRFLGQPEDKDTVEALHAHARTGRPLGGDDFVEALEQRLGRALKRQKPGPKPRQQDTETRDLFDNGA